jgi:hypothetical protein
VNLSVCGGRTRHENTGAEGWVILESPMGGSLVDWRMLEHLETCDEHNRNSEISKSIDFASKLAHDLAALARERWVPI